MSPCTGFALPWWGLPARLASALTVTAYVHTAYRVRGFGTLPSFDGPTLIISNHQIDLDLMAIISWIAVHGGWKMPFFTASAKLLHEPGFLACRVPWCAPLLHNTNMSGLFMGLGMLPIENQLRTRPLARWAFGVHRRHGRKPLEAVFSREIVQRYQLGGLSTSDLFSRRYFEIAHRGTARLSQLLEPYRKEEFEQTRTGVVEDLSRIENALRDGAAFYVTPEGEYSKDGAMLRFRQIWERLAPLARKVYVAGISYDPFVGSRLSQVYRIVPLRSRERVVDELKAARPITTSAMLAAWLHRTSAPLREDEAVQGVIRLFRGLPKGAWVDPEFVQSGARLVRQAVRHLRRHGTKHTQFPRVDDMVAYQARFFEETTAAAVRINECAFPAEREFAITLRV